MATRLAHHALPVDMGTFIYPITFTLLTLSWAVVWDIFLVNLTIKALVSLCSLPLIYLSPDRDWAADRMDA